MAELTRRSALLAGAGTVGVLGVAAAVAVTARDSTGAGASAAAGRAPARATSAVTAAGMVETLRRSDFADAVGLVFTARATRSFSLRLVEIADVAGGADPEHSFNLIFESASVTHPAEGVYRLSSDASPHRTLLLSPIGASAGAFQALVNTAA